MAEVVNCPSCSSEVSKRAAFCRFCGEFIHDVPTSLSPELFESLLDDDLPDLMFWYAAQKLENCGSGRSDRVLLAQLPVAVQTAYRLVLLDSEVRNGGFYQWFTNSSGQFADDTAPDLLRIGATRQHEVVSKALELNRQLESKYSLYRLRWEHPEGDDDPDDAERFWKDVETNFEPEFDRLSGEFYSLEDVDSLWTYFVSFVREHPEECVPPENES